jgi:hypothetical protein
MNRRSIIRVLLSLLLLLSQLMAASHAMSHATARMGKGTPVTLAEQAAADELSRSFAQDPTCDQCLGFAQLSGSIGSDTRSIAMQANQACQVAHRSNESAIARIHSPFQSRAPPVSV